MDKPDEGAVKPSDAAASVSAEMKQELQRVVMGIVPDLIKRAVKQSISETVPSLIKELTAAAPVEKKDEPADKAGEGERRSLKVLETQLIELRQQLQKRDEALEQEKQRTIDQQTRGEVHKALAGVLGADNPNLDLAMDSLYDARKRFVNQDGQTLVKFKGEYGSEENYVPLKEGMKKLVENELKHLMPAKTNTLPPAGPRRGQPIPAPQNGANNVLDQIFSSVASQAASAIADPTQK